MIDQEQLKKTYQSVVIVARAMISGCVLFGIMVSFLNLKNSVVVVNSQAGLFRSMIWVVGLAALVTSFVAKNIILIGNSNAGQLRMVKDPYVRLKMSVIIPFTLCEGAVLFGLVLAFVFKNPNDFISPILIGGIGFSSHFPKYQEWEEWVKSNRQNL